MLTFDGLPDWLEPPVPANPSPDWQSSLKSQLLSSASRLLRGIRPKNCIGRA